jgi:methionine-rich copper-binding protein CopC
MRVAIICASLVGAVLTVALLAAVARGVVATSTATTIDHVCANKSGQLFYLASCKKGQTSVPVTSSSAQFKACYQTTNGVTRKVPQSTKCSNKSTNKEIEIEVPADSDSLYFCVGTDGTMYFKGNSEPTCAAGQYAVVIGPHDAAPSVSSTLPVKDAEHIAVNRNIDITFSEAVNVTASSFTLECPPGTSKSFSVSGSGTKSITLDPTSDLPEGTSCTVTAIANNISDTDAADPPDHPASNTSFSFTTDSAPTVTSTTPADTAKDIDPSGNLTVTFSEPVNASASSFTLECPSGTSKSFSVSGSGTSTITLNPDADLPGTTVCTVTVLASGISDVDGGDPPDNLAANHVFSFTTVDAAPSVKSTSPTGASDHVAVDENITIDFSEPVTASTSSFSLECPTGTPRSFSVNGSPGSTITLDPTADLPEGTTCDVQVVATNISDTDTVDPPDHMAANHNFSFTTDSHPSVLSTTPDDGASDVEPGANVTVEFDEPVDVNATSFTLLCDGNAQPFTVSGSGTKTITLDTTSDLPGTASCTVSTVANSISDSDGGDPPDHPNQNTSFSFTTVDGAPSVTSTTPTDTADHLAVDTNIDIAFSEPVTATADSFTLECPTGSAVPFSVSGSGTDSITLTPTADLPEGTTCDVQVIANQISDTDVVDPPDHMAANHNFSFATDSHPSVLSITPADDASDIDPGANVTVEFDEPVDVGTGSFTLECPSGNAQPFTVSGSGTKTITLDPDSDLPGTSSCSVTALAANISDTDGGDPPDHPNQNESSTFTTHDDAPTVTHTSPADGDLDVPRTTNIDVTFSEPVTATADSFTLECPTGTPKSFALSGSGTSYTLDPDADLPTAETCAVKVIADQISDTDTVDPPDNMANDYTFSFDVAANLAPTDIGLGNSSVEENQPPGTAVGKLTTTDPDSGDTFTYSLVPGAADNASFQIGGVNADELQTAASLDYETKPSYTVLVKTTDGGGLSFEKEFTISVTNANDAPTDISLSNDWIDENQPSGTTVGALSATDPDAGQTQSFTLANSGCGGGPFDNGSFSISGTDLKSAASFDFETKPSYTICVRTTDNGTPTNLSFDEQFTIHINDANDSPVVTTSAGSNTFTEDGPAVAVDGGLTVADPDLKAILTSATVQITGNYQSGQDLLSFADTPSISGSFDPSTGKLTLSGTDTLANYQAALRSVTYSNSSQNPSSAARTVTFVVNDGSASNNLSNTATKTVNVTPVNDAPALTQPDVALGYTEDTPTENHQDAIAPNLTLSDVDSTTITGATVKITGNYQNGQDLLSFANQNGITGSLSASGDTLTLTGTTSVANYQTALRSVKYSNTSDNPSAATRTVTFQANDGGSANNLSNLATRDITVTPTNDAPVAVADLFTSTASSALANTTMTVGTTVSEPHTSSAGNPLSNDTDVDSPTAGFTVTPVTNATTTRGGKVTINSDGTFTYRPPPGITTNGGSSPDDTFTYTLHDNGSPDQTATGTVSVRIVGPTPWYVDDSAPAGGDGTSGSPFQSLGPLSTGGGSDTLDGPGDRIFVYSGNYTSGIALEDNQKLLGEPQGLSFTDNNGRSQSLVTAGGTAPAISSSSGPVVGLASGNELQDLALGNAGSGAASLSGTNVGSATAADSTINNTAGKAVDISGGTLNMAFTGVSSGSVSGSSTDGIRLDNTTGTFNAAGGSLQNATDQDVDISGDRVGSDNVAFTYNGSISDASGTAVSVASQTGGIKSFGGTIGNGSAISLSNNGGATMNFSGPLTLTTGTSNAFSATGGGTVNVTGSGNTIATTTGTALNVSNTTIGSNGLTFRSISANGATNGIVLNNTGANNALTVTGNGGTCTSANTAGCDGGFIRNSTGANDLSATPVGTGIVLNNTKGVSLTRMHIAGNSNFGIRGSDVNGFTLDRSVFDGVNGDTNSSGSTSYNESAVLFDNPTAGGAGLTGSASITNSSISGGYSNQVWVSNESGTLNRLTLDTDTFGDNNTLNGNDAVQIEGIGSATTNVTVKNSAFTAANGDLFQMIGSGNGGDLDYTNNTVSNSRPVNQIATGGGGVTLSGGGGSGPFHVDVHGTNTFRDSLTNAITLVKGFGPGDMDARITGATIGVAGVPNSGSLEGSGISFDHQGGDANSDVRLTMTNNTIRQYNNFGIGLQAGAGIATSGHLDMTVTGNTVANPGTNPNVGNVFQGIALNNGVTPARVNGDTVNGDSFQTCLDLANNIATNSGRNGGTDLRVRQRMNTTVRLPGYSGGASDTTAVSNFLLGQNTAATASAFKETTNVPSGGGFVGGSACAQATFGP